MNGKLKPSAAPAGKVTETFFGPGQQRMGGTLRRTDLAAGFGAQRR